jgi:hypothetical protein
MKMKTFAIRTSVVICLLSALPALGSNFTLSQLDPTTTDPLFKTLAATLAFRPVQPASSASLFGFSIGITGISANASQSNALSNNGTTTLYDADISAAIQVPLGFAFEAGYLPTLSFSGASIGRFGADVKWTFTDVFFSLPFNAAIRGCYTNGTLTDTQPLNGGTVNVNYSTNIAGGNLSFSKKFFIIEPYISYGLLQQSSNLSSSGSANLFDGNFPAGTTSISSSGSTGWFQVGAQIKLALFTIAAEYDNLFLDDTFALRLALSF